MRVSYPIDAVDVDLEMYRRRPHSVVAPYYANYFRLFMPGKLLLKMPLTVSNATPAGIMWHAGANETDPRFAVNRARLQHEIDGVLEQVRARPPAPWDDPS